MVRDHSVNIAACTVTTTTQAESLLQRVKPNPVCDCHSRLYVQRTCYLQWPPLADTGDDTAIRRPICHCRTSVNCQLQTAVIQCRTCLYSHFWATFLCYTCQLAHGESVLAVWQQQLGLTVAYCSSSDADAASHRTWGWGTNDDRWPSLVLVA